MAEEKVFLGDLPITVPSNSNDSLVGIHNDAAVTFGIDNILSGLYNHTAYGSNDLTNSGLYSMINALAADVGSRIKTVAESGSTPPQIVRNGSPYMPQDIQEWVFNLMSWFTGTVPSSTGTGENSKWSWSSPSSIFANGTQFTLDLNTHLFDNSWTANRTYYANAVVVYDNKLYKSKSQHVEGATFNPVYWDEIGGGGGGISGTPQEIWKGIYEGVLNGIARAFDIQYIWEYKGSDNYDASTTTYDSTYGYDFRDIAFEPYAYELITFYDATALSDIRRKVLEMFTDMAKLYPAFKAYKDSGFDSESWSYSAEKYSAYVYKKSSAHANVEYNANADFIDSLHSLFSSETDTYVIKAKFSASGWVLGKTEYSSLSNYEYFRRCALTTISVPTQVNIQNVYDYDNYAELGSSNHRLTNGTLIPFNSKIKKVTMVCDSENPEIKRWYNRILMTSIETHQAPADISDLESLGWDGTYAIISANYVPDVDIPVLLYVEI